MNLAALLSSNGISISAMAKRMLPRLGEHIDEARATIHDKHRTEWDADARRREAYSGEIDPEAALSALSMYHRQLLKCLNLLTLSLTITEEQNRTEIENEFFDELYSLVVMIHNPTLRYALVGAVDADVRQDVDDMFSRMSRELWGTLVALTNEGKITTADFPPEMRDALDFSDPAVVDAVSQPEPTETTRDLRSQSGGQADG